MKRMPKTSSSIAIGNNANTMMFFTQKGKCYWLKVYEILKERRTQKNVPFRIC